MDWQQRLPGSVPVVCRRMHRVFWVPRRYVSLVAIGLSGPFTVRAAAERTGYSVHGAWAAMRSLEEMAIARFRSTRGAKGSTKMTLSSDARVANVPPTATPKRIITESNVSEQGTFDLAAYKELVARLTRERLGIA